MKSIAESNSGSDPGASTISPRYRGRFAPSPTGPLHLGSLVAATASYLQARANRGEWLLRIEDLDPPRETPGAADRIINSLAAHAFHWQGEVRWQSSRLNEYHAVAAQLLADGLAYRCICSREDVRRSAPAMGPTGHIYPGTCRHQGHQATAQIPDALRLRTRNAVVQFDDVLQGRISSNVAEAIGDFIIRRKDGLIAYSLAVVIDDARQGITEIVRGCDLLDFTAAHIELQRVLALPTPTYMHVPVVINERSQKLGKRTGALAIDDRRPGENLCAALRLLRQNPPAELRNESADTIWAWATEHWQPEKLANQRQLELKKADNLH